MEHWETVVAATLALPGAERGTTYGKPAVKMNGKMIAATTGPSPDSFVLTVTLPEKEMLLETDPETFWETDHYKGWPAVLVRYGTDAHDRIETYIQRRWWDLAKKAQREAFGDRP